MGLMPMGSVGVGDALAFVACVDKVDEGSGPAFRAPFDPA